MKESVSFGRLIEEFGTMEDEAESPQRDVPELMIREQKGTTVDENRNTAALMQTEERNTGAVTWETYTKYLRFGGGIFWAPWIITLLALNQAAAGKSVNNTHFA